MLDDVRAFEFYYDSEQDSPKEDPSRVHERLEAVAEREGIDYDRTDIADWSDNEQYQLYEDTVAEIRGGREYHVGNRVFTAAMFGSARPALVIRYEDGEGVDVYPHRNDAVGPSLVEILDVLDEIEDGRETEDSDYGAIRTRSDDSEPGAAESDEDGRHETEASIGSRRNTGSRVDELVVSLKSWLPL